MNGQKVWTTYAQWADWMFTLVRTKRTDKPQDGISFLQELLDAAQQVGSCLPSLRRYACDAAAVPPALIRRAWTQLAHCRAFRVYGSSEVPLVSLGLFGADQMELAAETDGEVIAVARARLGETTSACVVLIPGSMLDFDSLAAHVKAAGVARQKLPKRLEIVATLPKTPSGKVRKDQLRQQFKEIATP